MWTYVIKLSKRITLFQVLIGGIGGVGAVTFVLFFFQSLF